MAASTTEVFDVTAWLNRANGRTEAPLAARPVPAAQATSAPAAPAYLPRHRADVPVDSAAS